MAGTSGSSPRRRTSSRAASTSSRRSRARRAGATDYTILGLHILEAHGFAFTARDGARERLRRLPFLQVYTAERATYRNLIYGLQPPQTARYRNRYREWIGAQIRADAFGYVCPGDPQAAARLAFVDASLSHVANGIYGEMWAAALISACFTAASMREALAAALTVVPTRSRLAEALRDVADQHARGVSWDELRDPARGALRRAELRAHDQQRRRGRSRPPVRGGGLRLAGVGPRVLPAAPAGRGDGRRHRPRDARSPRSGLRRARRHC